MHSKIIWNVSEMPKIFQEAWSNQTVLISYLCCSCSTFHHTNNNKLWQSRVVLRDNWLITRRHHQFRVVSSVICSLRFSCFLARFLRFFFDALFNELFFHVKIFHFFDWIILDVILEFNFFLLNSFFLEFDYFPVWEKGLPLGQDRLWGPCRSRRTWHDHNRSPWTGCIYFASSRSILPALCP